MTNKVANKEPKIAVIGLGYVGLPLAVEFGRKFKTIGFDINKARVDELKSGKDSTLEISDSYLKKVVEESNEKVGIKFSTDIEDIKNSNFYIVTVPTPTDKNNRPVLTPLYKASETVGKVLKNGDVVVYESTVYPGATEDECVPVLEKVSGLEYNVDFFVGYSPERINPGDKEHTVTKILKVTSGSTPEIAELVDNIYKSVIVAGTHKASSIKVAEAAKVIENSQRDINIAFVNELSKIFNKLEIDTSDVLEAAGTKWNFLPFKPGLVGGHCIGVDPYYLAQKAQEVGYNPEIILAGRRMNDGMGEWVVSEIIKLMINKELKVKKAKILVLGITFKENCPDIRNTKAVDVINELKAFGCDVDVYDSWASVDEVKHEYNLDLIDKPKENKYDSIVLAVSHNEFIDFNIDKYSKSKDSIIYDIKGLWDRQKVDGRL